MRNNVVLLSKRIAPYAFKQHFETINGVKRYIYTFELSQSEVFELQSEYSTWGINLRGSLQRTTMAPDWDFKRPATVSVGQDYCLSPQGSSDDDNDTIPNSSDNCPNTYNPDQEDTDGDGIGDVCDNNDDNAKPNLTLKELKIQVGSTTYDVKGKGEIPEFKYGEEHKFTITIENNDNNYASSSKYSLLVSEEDKYPDFGTKPVHLFRTVNGDRIDVNSQRTTWFYNYFYNNISTLNLENDKTYYMFLEIDPNNDVDESNETNSDNLYVFEFKYKKSTTGKISISITGNGSIIDVDFDYESSTNNLKIININNNSLMHNLNLHGQTPNVNLNLFDVLYAIYVNDVYIKKIKVTGSDGGPILEPYDSPYEGRY